MQELHLNYHFIAQHKFLYLQTIQNEVFQSNLNEYGNQIQTYI